MRFKTPPSINESCVFYANYINFFLIMGIFRGDFEEKNMYENTHWGQVGSMSALWCLRDGNAGEARVDAGQEGREVKHFLEQFFSW